MNREVFVNIKVKLPKECDVGFSVNDLEEIRNYYEKEFSNFDCLIEEFEISFVDKKTEQIEQLKQQLAEKNKMHLLDEKEFQNYCAYKWIEPEIKGCLEREREYKKQLAYKDMELLKFRKEKLYFELLISRLQWLHKRADDCRLEKERFGVADMSLCSVWDVLELQKNDLCEYEEMCALQEGIECVAKSKLLGDIEHDLQAKTTRNENEIFKDIEQVDQQMKGLKVEKVLKIKADKMKDLIKIWGFKESIYPKGYYLLNDFIAIEPDRAMVVLNRQGEEILKYIEAMGMVEKVVEDE